MKPGVSDAQSENPDYLVRLSEKTLASRLAAPGSVGLVLVLLSAACLAGSLLSAVFCVYSRLSDSHPKRTASREFDVSPVDPTTYKPPIAGWFGFIASVSSAAQHSAGSAAANPMRGHLQVIDRDAERQLLASHVVARPQNVLIKHRWVDRGWLLAGCALLGLVGFGVAYTSGV